MTNFLIKEKIFGRYVYITEMDFPLRNLSQYFSSNELRYIFGEDIVNPNYFEEIENDVWSTHLVFKYIQSNKFAGYLRIVAVKDIVEIHGGGINNSLLEKIALSESWLLIINKCFQCYKVNSIYTSCMIDNKKAYKLIIGSGFKETSRDLKENRINFSLTLDDFQNSCKTRFIKNR